jgi:hypothetical protein
MHVCINTGVSNNISICNQLHPLLEGRGGINCFLVSLSLSHRRLPLLFIMIDPTVAATSFLSTIGLLWAAPGGISPTGCGKELPAGQSPGSVSNVSITSSELERSYLFFVPPHYAPCVPMPIIFSYHGGSRTAEYQLELDQLTNPEFNKDAFVVYPQGIDVSQ